MYQVILYYNFKKIADPEAFCLDHKEKCRSLHLLGRVYIAREGINGTLTGSMEDIAAYKKYLCSLPEFTDTEFKDDYCDELPFTRLKIKTRAEAFLDAEGIIPVINQCGCIP